MQSVTELHDLRGKRVLLRADLNVPLTPGRGGRQMVRSSFRIKQILPTLQLLLQRGASVVVLSHFGRPAGKVDRSLSLKPVAETLAELLNRAVPWTDHVMSMAVRRQVGALKPGQLCLLGNLRFLPGEEKPSKRLAHELAELGDVYVNDAFSVCHRAHMSVVLLPKLLPAYAGLQLEKETQLLGQLKTAPRRPFVLILGGAKLVDKIPLMRHLLPQADAVILGGGIANTFLAASGEPVSRSLTEPNDFALARRLLKQYRHKLHLPVDWLTDRPSANTFRILDLGPLSLSRIRPLVSEAADIFWNGDLGLVEDDRFSGSTRQVGQWLAKHSAHARTIVSGGDTTGFLDQEHLLGQMSFVSTGGGATLAYLAGQPMPGLASLDA